MRITIDITEGEVTAITAADSPSAGVTAPAPGGQPAGTQDINAGPAPVIPAAGPGGQPGGQPGGAAPAAAGGTGQGAEGISAGPAPAGLTRDPASPETNS
jgi:hypothetical protein